MMILVVVVVCVGQMVEFSSSDVAASSRVINTHNTNTHNFLIYSASLRIYYLSGDWHSFWGI
jgi:hypothetical protein